MQALLIKSAYKFTFGAVVTTPFGFTAAGLRIQIKSAVTSAVGQAL